MARRSPQTQAKRAREFAKLEKRQEKAEKKAQRKLLKEAAANGELPPEAGEVTDVADLPAAEKPGPQDS